MWAGVYLAVLAIAGVATYFYVVEERSVEFMAAVAGAGWGIAAVSGGAIDVVSDGTTSTVTAGAAQYVFAGLAILSLAAFLGALMGWYPEDRDPLWSDFEL
ncbi:hypothetical protein [Natrarchaeobaculum aegyptiacum]|uniref:Uncharacterized protein n=1 Tax=Natrarchaeobaculum aegyptiacum TaxID=745377 RepID=A0A2Z2HUU0_9EURY|nr:hypothetical protein [Natrarchaeobaculum aegyptiacum]ARS89925.1 hypothetical protein B1756_09415 [Natrarchaeobaculum aegyptiacum]